jgi:hypothetical protein
MKRFWAVICPFCGQAQGMEIRKLDSKVFQCKYCHKSRKLRQSRAYGLSIKVLGSTDNVTALPLFISEYNRLRFSKLDDLNK